MACRNVLASVLTLAMPFVGVASFCDGPALGHEGRADDVVFETVGYIVPKAQVTVSARVAGQVVELNIEEGKVVKKGDVLARLESSEYKAELEAAKARVQIATLKLERSKTGAPALDTTIAKAELTVAAADLDKAQARLDATVVVAPIDGTILTKKAEIGTNVHPLGFNVTPSICEMADLRELDVDVSIQERDIGVIAKGQPCRIQLNAYPDTTYKGRVLRILPVADRAKGTLTVRVRIEVPEKDEQLRPEMRAVVSFLGKKN